MAEDEGDAVVRVEGAEHERVQDDLHQAEPADGEEPDGHDGAKGAADGGGAVALHQEQAGDDGQGGGDDEGGEVGGNDFQTLNGGKNGDGGGDDAVTEKQACAHDAEDADNVAGFCAAGDAGGQGHEGEGAAFAVIVGAHDEGDIFEGDDDRQRPEDQRENAIDIWGLLAGLLEIAEGGLQGVERAGAEVAVDDAENGDEHAHS